MIKYDTMLERYLLGKEKKYEKELPLTILNDPLVRYVRDMVRHGKCPFCYKTYISRSAVIQHLTRGDTQCRGRFSYFVKITVDRYRLLDSKGIRQWSRVNYNGSGKI